jgi:hypothetical protein
MVGQETMPSTADRAAVSDLCVCLPIHREKITHDTNALRKKLPGSLFFALKSADIFIQCDKAFSFLQRSGHFSTLIYQNNLLKGWFP